MSAPISGPSNISFDEFKNRVWGELKRCIKIVNNEIPLTKFPIYVKYDLKGRSAGYAKGTSHIALNSAMLMENPSEIESTTAHELAHLVVHMVHPEAKPHGYEWKSWMIAFNHSPEITHWMPPATTYREKYIRIWCKCREHYVTKYKFRQMVGGKIFYCIKCKTILR